jgi:glycosyltransferase involved in cell wall biosynthesis
MVVDVRSPMKVAIDVHSLGTQAGGNETFYRQLLEGLVQDGSPYCYTLFYTRPDALSSVKLDQRFMCRKISANPIRRICVSLPRALRALRPDVFHCQYILPPAVRSKTVVTIHDLAHEHYPQYFTRMEALRMRKLVPWSARRADHIITVSEYSARDIETLYGIPRSRITVAYQAAASKFRPRDQQNCRAHLESAYGLRSPFLLYVGRVQARKNLIRLVEAYALVRSRHPELKLVIVGKPDLHYGRLLARVQQLRLNDAVVLPGYVSDDDLPLFYNVAEIFIFPSIFEGFGLPIMESMASGVPTITSAGSCLREIAGDGALLVDPLSVDSIADGIGQVMEQPQLRSQLIERGLRRSAWFSTQSFARKILDVYESVLC